MLSTQRCQRPFTSSRSTSTTPVPGAAGRHHQLRPRVFALPGSSSSAAAPQQLRSSTQPLQPLLLQPQRQQLQHHQQQQQRRRGAAAVCAAAAGAASAGAGGAQDPFRVLGIDPDSDTNAINRAYTLKKYAARGDDAATAQIEAAHSTLMMRALNARMRGGAGAVPKSVRYADTEPLFPWRPKRWDATPKVIAIVGVLQMAMTAYGFQAPNMSKVVGSMLLGIAGNVLKQNAIAPPPKDASMATEEEAGRAGRNFIRGALLGVGATVAGVLLFGAPEYLGSTLRLPASLTEPGLVVSLKIAGACICNWVITSFFY